VVEPLGRTIGSWRLTWATSIEIACPRPVVAEFVSNPDNATRWYVNITSISWQTPPPGGHRFTA
jgi:hypothetical protein